MINRFLISLSIYFFSVGAALLSAADDRGIYPAPSACIAPTAATGHAFYVDPSVGSMANRGSTEAPWSTLSAVIRAGLFVNGTIRAGDTVYLRSGDHGSIGLSGSNFDFITIAADSGATPVISSVNITGSKWIIRDLTIESPGSTLVNIRPNASNNIIVGNHILSQPDVRAWTRTDWQNHSSLAVSINGQCTTILNNNIENIRWGILANADHALIQGNTINNIGDDGMQVTASDIIIRGNRLTNFHDIGDGNHADMIQAFTLSNRVYHDITIDGNIGINQTDPNLPFPNADTQGITEFDGRWNNYSVINNVVVTNHWHGISIYGATNATLINNTVFGDHPSRVPWIGVFASKTGALPVNNIVRNNLAGSYRYPSTGFTQDHNVVASNPAATVVKFDTANYAFDLRPKAGSPAIGAGAMTGAPAADITGSAREPPIDAGAYAYKKGDAGRRDIIPPPAAAGRASSTALSARDTMRSNSSQSASLSATTLAASSVPSCTPPKYSTCGYPDASNTGVPPDIALTSRQTDDGCLVVSNDNTVIDALHVTGCIDVEANNVTIQNSRVTATTGIWWAIKYGATKPNATGLKILHVTVESIPGQGPAADGGYPYGISTQGTGSLEVGYSNISGFKDGIDVAQGYIHDNWIHDLAKYADAHTQGIYVWAAPSGGSLLIKHNTITDIILDSTAAIFMKEGLGIHDVTIQDNWLAGGSYTLYGGGADTTNIQVLDNRFSTEITPKGGQYGSISYWSSTRTGNLWRNNAWVNGPRAGQPIAPAY
ncbi:right-handed parallel beta-helix repeat-containing protein [Bradyrhizobium sp. STM 3562]|uniref:right-handed parallel beta-helix repeat-containing protein n=1 Tax=Bradyrhizobium sp. STM 3562 TaxID=578924 RepID=UPI003890DD72